MGICRISIKNYKSIKKVCYEIDNQHDVYCILGKNGAGKSNFLDAIKYFYERLDIKNSSNNTVLDKVNTYTQKMQIEIIFDFGQLMINSLNPYIGNMLDAIDEYIIDRRLSLKLVQYRNGVTEWYPNDKNIRKCISKLFPLYMIDTRFITLQEWSEIWEITGALAISNTKVGEAEINKKLDKVFEETYGEKYTKALERIQQVLGREKVDVNHKDYSTKFKSALQTRMGGYRFEYDGNPLGYYSDGINSLKYIKLCLQLISTLANTGWKNPLIILDEPEMGLHISYIDELIECISRSFNKRVNIIFSTHSPYLVAGLQNNEVNVALDRVFEDNNYSKIERMREIVEEVEKNLISTRETECYFANAIVFVEGKTECQVFRFKRLIELFPLLRKVHFYQSADGASMRMVNPSNERYTVPYLIISDMDKIIKFNEKTKRFEIKKDSVINPLYSEKILKNQRYMYYKKNGKKSDTYGQYKKIKKVLNNHTYDQNYNKYWLNGSNYNYLIQSVKNFCCEYQVYPVSTTIEGCLVNEDNYNIIIEWLNQIYSENEKKKLAQIMELPIMEIKKCKVTFLRLVLNGKLDCLYTISEAENILPMKIRQEVECLKVGKKAKGWVFQFLDYYFKTQIDTLNGVEKKRNTFRKHFREIFNILQIVFDMIE